MLLRSRDLAWNVTGAALIITALAVVSIPIGLAVLLPLKEKIPMPIKIDTCTGAVEPIIPLSNSPKQWSDVFITSETAKYLRNREAYHPSLVGLQYKALQLTSNRAEATALAQEWQTSNPRSPARIYGQDRVDVSIIAIRPQQYGAMVIEYVRTEFVGKPNQTATRYQSTIFYEFTNTPPEGDLEAVNALGFSVTGYRRDAVQLNTAAK
jgi:type IV secretion system protein VirB8